jgi:hypothetical protein
MGRLTSSTAERLAAGRGCFGEFVDPRGVTGGRLVHTEEVLDREWPDLWRQARRARERSPLVGARKGFQRHFIGSARFWSGWPKSQATRARDRRATAPAIRLGPAAWVPKRFVTRHSPRRGTAPANRCRTRRMSPTSTSFWTFRLAIKASRLARRRSRKARTPDDGPQLHEVGGRVGQEGELPDRDHGTTERKRRQDDVDRHPSVCRNDQPLTGTGRCCSPGRMPLPKGSPALLTLR